MVIRTLRPEDMEESIKLSQYAFQYELTREEERERIARFNPMDSWGAFMEDGSLAAKLTILPLEIYVGGRKLAMGGVAGVATWPEHRRGGLVSRLIANALAVMKERGQTVSFLHPFQFAFYRKFGWETYTEYKKYELETAQIPRFPDAGGKVARVSGYEILAPVYEEYASRFNGSLVRSPEWWRWNILQMKNKGGSSAVYYDAKGTPKGYLLYKVRDNVMTVNEFVALDEDARRGIWNFIGNHDSMIGKVTLQAEAGDRLTSLLKDPRIKQEVVSYFMGRLVDAPAFLNKYSFAEGVSGSLRLYVTDGQAPWNQGLYRLTWGTGGGQAEVEFSPCDPPETGGDVLACGIGELTAMLLGYERPAFMRETHRLEGNTEAVDLLEAAIPRRSTYLLDYF